MIHLELTQEECRLLGEALAGHSTHVSKMCESFARSAKYNAAHRYFKGKSEALTALHVKVIQGLTTIRGIR